MLHLKIGAHGFPALIDSGATHNFIGKQCAAQVGARSQLLNAATLTVQLANGGTTTTLGACRLPVQFGSQTQQLLFHVLDMPIDAVLGMPWLQRANPSIDWAQGLVSLRYQGRWTSVPAVFGRSIRDQWAELQASVAPVVAGCAAQAGGAVCTTAARSNAAQSRAAAARNSTNAPNARTDAASSAATPHDVKNCAAESGGTAQVGQLASKNSDLVGQVGGSAPPQVEVKSVVQFERGLKQCKYAEAWLGFIAADCDGPTGQDELPASDAGAGVHADSRLYFTHRTAFGTPAEGKSEEIAGSPEAQRLLADVQAEYPEVFAEPTFPPPERPIKHPIVLKPGCDVPPKRKLYPLSEDELKELKTQITKFLDSGRIVPSSSPYGAPVLFAKKKDGGLRLCFDYRGLNAQTVLDTFPLPRTDELLARLRGAKVFSKVDLRDGYHQVAMEPSDVPKTAFNCRYGSFEWRVMPFGLTNAPSTFQKLMNHVFYDLLDECVVVYLDDILIFSRSEADHRRHVRMVFERLRSHNLHCKASKCTFLTPRVEFLGHVISADGVAVDPAKTSAVAEWPTPTSVHDIQVFLGLCNYYRRFIHRYAHVARPLTDLTRKDVPFVWTPECETAFRELQTRMTQAPVLAVFVPDQQVPTRIVCDASDYAAGAVLEQAVEPGVWKPVEYLSKRLSSAEMNYSATEREFLGLVLSLRQWRHYLVGRPVEALTDHASLQYLQTQAKLSRRQARWLDLISEFAGLTIRHTPGATNRADHLSRRPDLRLAEANTVLAVESTLLDSLREAQARDTSPWFLALRARAEDTTDVSFVLRDGLVCRAHRRNGFTIVVPEDVDLRRSLIAGAHEPPLSGHLGVYRTVGTVSQRYFWRGMERDVKRFVAGCQTCQASKVETAAPQGPLQPLPVPEHCWEQVTMDLITHLPMTPAGHDAIATFVDRLSKFVYFVPCSVHITAPELADLFIRTVVCNHGMPSRIISDRDPRFLSHFWQALVAALQCKHSLSSSYHPETDGQSERFHRSLHQVMRCYVAPHQKDWERWLPFAQFALNSTRSASTREAPFFVVYGRHPVLPHEHAVRAVTDCKIETTSTFVQRMGATVAQVRQDLAQASAAQAKQANKRRRAVQIKNGDLVWVRADHLRFSPTVNRKWTPRFFGPCRVLRVVNPVAFQVELPTGYRIHDVFHASQLRVHVAGHASQEVPPPPPVLIDGQLEHEVEDIIDVRTRGQGTRRRREFLIKWLGYGLFDATWEPEASLENCQRILHGFLNRRGVGATPNQRGD